MARFKAMVVSHVAMKSAQKGTPGIEFAVSIQWRWDGKGEGQWVETEHVERRVWLYFGGGNSNEMSLKKLRHAGWEGGSLAKLNLVEKWVDIDSSTETWKGKQREKYDLALPPLATTVSDDEAFLAIDAVMTSAGVAAGPSAPPTPETSDEATGEPDAGDVANAEDFPFG